MSSTRGGRARSVSLAFANLSKPVSNRRSQSSLMGLMARSVRVVVLGVGGVGKTAMIVRFITKRFIGDYDPTLESIYRHTATINDQLVHFEIMDTAGQEENSVMLEDKCKWGESFIFVYDVTDKYSFDELTRLKFIASYTHSRMRVSFKPCWILIGNKTDLAEHDRMVSTEEGMALARDLGCHMFREISVKESMSDASEVFEDLWREFSRLSPRSPSTSQRRKYSCKLQDKISVLDSEACTCASEVLKGANPSIVSSLTSALKRQTSVPALYHSPTRSNKEAVYSDSNNNDERFDASRIQKIPEHQESKNDVITMSQTPKCRRKYSRRSGIVSNAFESKFASFPSLTHAEAMCKAVSVDNVCASDDVNSNGASATFFTSSSRSSSSSSLNGSTSPCDGGVIMKPLESPGSRHDPSYLTLRQSDSPSSDDLASMYRDHCLRNRSRRSVNSFTPSPSCPLSGY